MSKNKEIDFSVLTTGPMYVSPEHIEPGFRYVMPTNRPGEIQYYQRLGYEVVIDLSGEVKAGLDKPSTSSALGTAVTIQSKCGATHVLMKIPEELGKKIDAAKQNAVRQQRASLGHVSGIPADKLYGGINIK